MSIGVAASNLEHASPGPASGDVSLTQLLTGIMSDAQQLAVQHFALFRSEIQRDLATTREALIAVGLGASLCTVGGLVLCHMLAHLVQFVFPVIPLWGSYGIVGGVTMLAGAIPLVIGVSRLRNLNPLSEGIAQVRKGFGS